MSLDREDLLNRRRTPVLLWPASRSGSLPKTPVTAMAPAEVSATFQSRWAAEGSAMTRPDAKGHAKAFCRLADAQAACAFPAWR
jgi:hypothetical protein